MVFEDILNIFSLVKHAPAMFDTALHALFSEDSHPSASDGFFYTEEKMLVGIQKFR